jgi:hypothetical protein
LAPFRLGLSTTLTDVREYRNDYDQPDKYTFEREIEYSKHQAYLRKGFGGFVATHILRREDETGDRGQKGYDIEEDWRPGRGIFSERTGLGGRAGTLARGMD